jgi:imidazolonepropionase-like amidohydrolase
MSVINGLAQLIKKIFSKSLARGNTRMSKRICLKNANIWTGAADALVLENCDLEIEEGRIVDLQSSRNSSASMIVDCQGRWVMPGLIDAHMHFFGARSSDPLHWCIESPIRSALRAAADARRMIEAGFTSARDAGSQIGPALRDVIAEKEILGPRVVAAYLGISRTGGHGDVHSLPIEWVRERPFMALIADGVDECRRVVRQIARSGSEWIKIWATGGCVSERDNPQHSHMSREELKTIVEEAHSVDLKVGAHCEGLPAAKDCVAAGVDFIEHGFYLDESVCKSMAEKNIPLVSTLSFIQRTANWNGPGVAEYAPPKARKILDDAVESLALAHSKGVPIAMGTDTFAEPLTPFGLNAEELICLNEAGLSSESCLVAATRIASEVLGLSKEIGTIEIGKQADIIVLGHTCPLDNLRSVVGREAINLVLKAGEIVSGIARKDLIKS